jgi:hypothetical protein
MVAADGDAADLDRDVRLEVYRTFAETGRPPSPPEIARALALDTPTIEGSLRRLADGHVLVLAPGTPYVWMANPFSAIPTPFAVRAGDRRYWGNCAWDSLGIAACLATDARVETFCPDCAEPLELEVRGGRLAEPADGVVQFEIPAARWWEDIGAT